MSIFDALDVEAIIITGGTNRRYFSGWSAEDHAPDRPAGVMLITRTDRLLYASPTNVPWAEAEVQPDVTVNTHSGSWLKAVAGEIRSHDFRRVAFEDLVTPVASYRELESSLEGVELIPAGAAIDELRVVKSDREIELSSRAIHFTDIAFERAAAALRAGMTERELAWIVEDEIRRAGCDGLGFPVIVAAGSNAARPHHTPGDHAIAEGEPVIIDMGGEVGGYRADLTRTIWAGQPGERLVTMYRLVAEAERAAIAAVSDGVAAKSVDGAARAVFERAGLAEAFVHGAGHGVGLRIHEAPFLSRTSDEIIQAGSIMTIEPGLYFPDWGGIRLEDVVLVTGTGCRVLSAAPKLLGV